MSSADPEIKNFPYSGWVPTVNGRLSFRHIGESDHPARSIYANVATERRRIVLCYQARPSADVLFPWALSAFFGITGKFWFAITAESNDVPSASDSLSGVIYIFKSKEDWRQRGEPAVRATTTLQSLNSLITQNEILALAKNDKRARQQIKATNIRTVAFAFLASAIAVWATLIQPYLKEKAFPLLTQSSWYVANHAAGSLATILLICFVIWCFGIDIFRYSFGRDVLEAANVERRKTTPLFLGLGFIVFGFTLYFGWPAIKAIISQALLIWGAIH